MKRLLIIASIFVLTLVTAAIAIPFLVPSSVYRAQIEQAASTALGREVTLLGEAKLSVFPTISVKIGGAQVANLEGFDGAYMIEAGQLRGSVKLLPLLSKRVEVNRITLSDATIRLERLADGTTNWEFITPDPDAPDSTFNGGIARARLTNTAVYYKDHQTGTQYALTEFNAEAKMTALDKPLTSKGDGRLNGQVFEYDIKIDSIEAYLDQQPAAFDVTLDTEYGKVHYNGLIAQGVTPSFDGKFDIRSETIGTVLQVLGIDLPIRADQLDSVRASGDISGPANALSLTFSDLSAAATGLDFNFRGSVMLNQVPQINGHIELVADRADRLLKSDQPAVKFLAILGKVNLTADVDGLLAQPILSNIRLKQRSPLLSTDYSGSIPLAPGQPLSGDVSIQSDDVRGLASALDILLPEGERLQTFSFDGKTQGTSTNILLNDTSIKVDALEADGSVGVDLQGRRPRVIADLTMAVLDLTPLLGAGADTADTQPSLNEDWNDDPLALNGLNMIDATIDIAASRVVLDQITLEDALLKTRIDDGRLSAIFRQDEGKPGFRAFDGNWSGDLVLDASRSTPTLEIEALADTIAAQKMLGALTGYNGLRGIGDVHVDLSSRGNTLKALIGGLDGRVESDLSNGALTGLNLAKLVRSGANVQDLLTSGDLSLASFRDAISPDAETDFSSLVGHLQLSGGIAQITNLKLDNPVIGITGSGAIDLLNRSIDIRLVPAVDVSAQGQGLSVNLADIPIPVRIYGSWSNVHYELDSAYVRAELTARARGRIGDEIAGQVGGPLGTILGGVIGGQSPPPPASDPADPDTESVEPESNEIDDVLGALFGNDSDAPDN